MNSCSPGKGRTYLTIGQDLFSIQEYVTSQYNHSLHNEEGSDGTSSDIHIKTMSSFAPAATMFYTDLEKLDGLTTPTDYGSGIEYADGIVDSLFPNTDVGVQIGLWLNGTYGCDQINDGKMQDQLQILSDYLDSNKFSGVFLRIGYEFDNPFFGYSNDPEGYVKAYKRIVRYLRDNLSDRSLLKTKFVWHSWAAPKKEGVTLEDLYPGDEFVDWVGISVFQQLFPWSSNWANGYVNWGGDESDIHNVLTFAKMHGKPTMIAESTPFGGINLNNSETILFDDTDPWERWFGRVLSLIEKYDIDMWSYINCDWDVQPMWRNVGFGDTRLSSNSHVMQKWQHYVIESKGNQTFLMGNSLECGIPNNFSSREDIESNHFHREYTLGNVLQFLTFVLCFYTLIFTIRKVASCVRKRLKKSPSSYDEQTPIMQTHTIYYQI